MARGEIGHFLGTLLILSIFNMARQLDAAGFDHLGLKVLSSSHLSPLDEICMFNRWKDISCTRALSEKQDARGRFRDWLPENSNITAIRGLTVMYKEFPQYSLIPFHKKTDKRIKQEIRYANAVKFATQKIALDVTGSNDYKFFIVKDNQLVPMVPNGLEIWSNLTKGRKINFSTKHRIIFPKDSREFMESRIREYVSYLKNVYSTSSFVIVYHSSLLERISREKSQPCLEAYFAHLNYFLHVGLRKLNEEPVLNVNGLPISFKFINVSEQFFNAVPPTIVFKDEEQTAQNLIHRHIDSLKILVEKYMNFIYEDLRRLEML